MSAHKGFTVFFTGLSGAGKTTLSRSLVNRWAELSDRPMTVLDGDEVRELLSSELGFSKEHRDLNIRRIGFVAAEITRHGGIAVCAPIAPYSHVRQEVRNMVSAVGKFVEIHVCTPLEVCEERDVKGLYAKARSGEIPQFTGISDPYEEPKNPELRIDTSQCSIEEGVERVIETLRELDLL